jgi:hypothetical protein
MRLSSHSTKNVTVKNRFSALLMKRRFDAASDLLNAVCRF